MKRKVNLLIFVISIISIGALNAQLVNNGGTIIVKDGATLHVDADLTNTTGTLQLEANSTLEVSGDFTSEVAASFDADANSLVKFFGSTSKNIKSGGDDFGNVLMAKDDTKDMSLVDDMTVTTNLDFTPANGNKLVIGANDLTFGAIADVTNNGTNRYIQADGAGVVKKNYTANGSFEFPIGDVTNYSPITANVTATAFGGSANLAVNVVDAVHPNKYTDAESYITRYWKAAGTDMNDWTATLTGTYTDADIVGTEANIKGANYIADWSFANAGADNALNIVTADISANSDFTGMNYYGKMASLKAFLQGAYSGSEMKTTLTTLPLGANDGDHFPDTSPYGTGETVASLPADVTDWIKIEMWDAVPATVTKSYSKFVKKNGDIVELDGTTPLKFKDAPSSSYIVLHHRNHLDIRTNATHDLSTNASFDFTTSANQANIYDEGWSNEPQKDLGSSIYGMWGGNANGNTNVRWNGPANDKGQLLNTILSGNTSNVLTSVYSDGDLNFDKKVRWNGPGNDKGYLLNTVLSGNTSTILKEHK